MRGPQQALLRSDFASLRSLSLVCLILLNSKSQVLFPIHGEPDPTHPTLLLLLLLSRFSSVRLCATPWTAAYQASPSMGFSRKEHWSGLPFPSPTTPTYSEPKLGLFRSGTLVLGADPSTGALCERTGNGSGSSFSSGKAVREAAGQLRTVQRTGIRSLRRPES